MSTVTPRLGLVKPTSVEQYALSVFNNNMDIIDEAVVHVDSAFSTADWTNFSFLLSRFTRVRTGNTGIVVAHIQAKVDTADTVPFNTQTGDDYGNVAPVGYRPERLQSYTTFVQSAAGRGDNVQCALATDGSWFIRSNTAGGFTTTVNAIVHCFWTYEWDGNLE